VKQVPLARQPAEVHEQHEVAAGRPPDFRGKPAGPSL